MTDITKNCQLLFVLVMFRLLHICLLMNSEDKSLFQVPRCRMRAFRGDVGELDQKDTKLRHPKDVLKFHSRKKRLVSFPKGSSLTIKNELSIATFSNSYKSFDLFIGVPFSLDLPDGKLTVTGSNLGFGHANRSSSFVDTVNDMGHRRSLDQQRKTGFQFLEGAMQSLGLPGKTCLLKAICENADQPVESFGFFGEVLSMFLAVGFRGGEDATEPYLEAEEEGRKTGSCTRYDACPVHLTDFLYGGLAIAHSGFANL